MYMPDNSERRSSMENDNFLEVNQLYRALDDLTSSPRTNFLGQSGGKLAYRCRLYDDNWRLTLSYGSSALQFEKESSLINTT